MTLVPCRSLTAPPPEKKTMRETDDEWCIRTKRAGDCVGAKSPLL